MTAAPDTEPAWPVSRSSYATNVLPTREQQAHKLWADSCIELQRIEKMLAPAFERHQKALDACAEYGSENRLRMNPYMQEAWMTWEAKRQVEIERTRKP